MRRAAARWAVLLGSAVAWACADAPTETAASSVPAVRRQAEPTWDAIAATRWNDRATQLLHRLPAPPNGQAWASRMLTYLSLAQYRAALAATAAAVAPTAGATRPSVSAAVARASVAVLSHFYAASPGVPVALERQLADDRGASGEPGGATADVAAGEGIGLAAGKAVLVQAARDGYLSRPAPTPPVGETYWVGTGAVVRSLWGATPFFLAPGDLLRAPAPPPEGSPAFQAALAEVYAVVQARTPEQLALALEWDKVPPNGPFTAGTWNQVATALLRAHPRPEVEAARVLAYANAAAFDAQIDCFETKFRYWVRRPSHVDGRITPMLAFTPIPNHPSYPSAHSCISSALGAVLAEAFPEERGRLEALVEEAGASRVYAGIHYGFDVEEGQGIGRRAAAKALAGSLE